MILSNLSRVFCIFDESIKTVINNLQVILELPLSRDNPPHEGNFPVWNVEGRPMFCFKEGTIHCLWYIYEKMSMIIWPTLNGKSINLEIGKEM